MTTGKMIALTIWTFVGKVMSLLFNMLSRFVIAFFPRSKHLLKDKSQVEPEMEHQTCSKLGKKYVKAVYCHPAYLTYIQRTSCDMLAG